MTHDPGAGSAILQKPQFDVAKRGYEKSQVDQYLARVGHDVARTAATLREERDAARASSQQLMAERDDALREMRAARQELAVLSADGGAAGRPARDEVSIFGERLQTILAAAEQEASAVRAEARQAAEGMRAEAEERAAAALAQATRESDALLAQARDEAAETTRQTQAQTQQLLESAQREATEKLDALRREADRTRSELEHLQRLREQVRRELTGIGAAIEDLLGAADPASATSASAPSATM